MRQVGFVHSTSESFLLQGHDLLLKRSFRLRSSSSTRALNWVQSSSWDGWIPNATWSSADWLRRKGLYCFSSPTVEGHWRGREHAEMVHTAALKDFWSPKTEVHSQTNTLEPHQFIVFIFDTIFQAETSFIRVIWKFLDFPLSTSVHIHAKNWNVYSVIFTNNWRKTKPEQLVWLQDSPYHHSSTTVPDNVSSSYGFVCVQKRTTRFSTKSTSPKITKT